MNGVEYEGITGFIGVFILPLCIGYILDLLFGDPRKLPHPVVGFGNMIFWIEKKWNRGKYRKLKGGLVAFIYPLSVVFLCWGIGELAMKGGIGVYSMLASVAVFYGLANRSLIEEGREVIRILETEGLEAGRKRLSWIVGRDTSALSRKEIYTAVLETMSENLSDGVVAPLFFYALGGFPGMMVYKMVNTLDSMIGYRDERYREFGCCAARLDDVFNYIPARLTAFFMAVVAYRRGLSRFIFRYHNQHNSPNAGFPEAAMAGILGCRFGGPHVYHGITVEKPFIGNCDRNLGEADYRKAVQVNHRVTILMVFGTIIVSFAFFLILK